MRTLISMEWLYRNKPINETRLKNYLGFVYIIENMTNGRKYIGQKKLQFKKTKYRVNKRNQKFLVESDWKSYYGSNEELQKDVVNLGPENFKREILKFCKSKSEMNYLEAKEQFKRDVLLKKEYYNNFIGCKINGRGLKK